MQTKEHYINAALRLTKYGYIKESLKDEGEQFRKHFGGQKVLKSNKSTKDLLQLHFYAFKSFLSDYLPPKAASREQSYSKAKLHELSTKQLSELSTDLFDEINRRETLADKTLGMEEVQIPFLPLKEEFHPRRNQARQKLATLSETKFKDLLFDVLYEIKRKNLVKQMDVYEWTENSRESSSSLEKNGETRVNFEKKPSLAIMKQELLSKDNRTANNSAEIPINKEENSNDAIEHASAAYISALFKKTSEKKPDLKLEPRKNSLPEESSFTELFSASENKTEHPASALERGSNLGKFSSYENLGKILTKAHPEEIFAVKNENLEPKIRDLCQLKVAKCNGQSYKDFLIKLSSELKFLLVESISSSSSSSEISILELLSNLVSKMEAEGIKMAEYCINLENSLENTSESKEGDRQYFEAKVKFDLTSFLGSTAEIVAASRRNKQSLIFEKAKVVVAQCHSLLDQMAVPDLPVESSLKEQGCRMAAAPEWTSFNCESLHLLKTKCYQAMSNLLSLSKAFDSSSIPFNTFDLCVSNLNSLIIDLYQNYAAIKQTN